MTMHGDDLPPTARRAVGDLRRLEPPPGMLPSIMQEVAATPQRRPSRLPLIGLATVAATAAAVMLIAVVAPLRHAPSGPAAGSSGVSPGPGQPGGTIAVRVPVVDGAHPGSADANSVWLGSEETGRVIRLDATTGNVVGEIEVNDPTGQPYDLWPVSDGSSAWVAGRGDRALVRVDIESMRVVSRWPIDAVAYRIAPSGRVIWVSDFDGDRVLAVAATDGHVIGEARVRRPTGIAVTPAVVYVVGYEGDLVEIDPVTLSDVRRHRVAPQATDILDHDGGLLIWGLGGRALERFDPIAGEITATLGGVSAAALVDGGLWAATGNDVTKIDERNLAASISVPLGDAETDQLVASGGRLWVFVRTPQGTFIYGVDPGA